MNFGFLQQREQNIEKTCRAMSTSVVATKQPLVEKIKASKNLNALVTALKSTNDTKWQARRAADSAIGYTIHNSAFFRTLLFLGVIYLGSHVQQIGGQEDAAAETHEQTQDFLSAAALSFDASDHVMW